MSKASCVFNSEHETAFNSESFPQDQASHHQSVVTLWRPETGVQRLARHGAVGAQRGTLRLRACVCGALTHGRQELEKISVQSGKRGLTAAHLQEATE